MRGISEKFAKEFKDTGIYKNLYEKHKDELIISVRENRINLYYNCDSIADIRYNYSKYFKCSTKKYYFDGIHRKKEDKNQMNHYEKDKFDTISDENIYKTIKYYSDKRENNERKAQSKLVILNNNNDKSNWYCVDVEYVKKIRNVINARFDIIAISRKAPFKIALIELKYGAGSFGGKSGVFKHVQDFTKFMELGFYDALKDEIIEMLKSQINLGLSVPFTHESLPNFDKNEQPEFYFITLDNSPKEEGGSSAKQSMSGYLFNDKRWGCRVLSKGKRVEQVFGDITDPKNLKVHAKFRFSDQSLDNMQIKDILDDDDYDKVPN